MDTDLLKFTRCRNFYIARLKGASAIFSGWSISDFPEDIKEKALKIGKLVGELETLVSSTWPKQKIYFVKNHPPKERIKD